LYSALKEKPLAQRVGDSSGLDWLECAILDHPPVYRRKDGQEVRRAKGLIRESYLPAPRTIYFREAFPTIPRNRWDKLIADRDAVDLALYSGYRMDQDAVGSCAAESANNGVEVCEIWAGQKPTKFNPWFGYHTTSGGVDRGSSLQDNLRFIQEYGCCPEKVWPRSKGWRTKPSAEAYEAAKAHRLLEFWEVTNWDEFASALLYGMPVYFGYPGHAILAVKLLAKDRLLYENSWGADWGDNGFGSLSCNRIAWEYGAYAFRLATDAVE